MAFDYKKFEEYRSKLPPDEQLLTDLCMLVDLFPPDMRRDVFFKAIQFAKPTKHDTKRKARRKTS